MKQQNQIQKQVTTESHPEKQNKPKGEQRSRTVHKHKEPNWSQRSTIHFLTKCVSTRNPKHRIRWKFETYIHKSKK